MSEAQPSEVVTQGSSAAAVAARDVPWSENVAAAEAKLAALEAEGKGPAEPSRRTRTGRDDAGRFKAAGKEAPTPDATPEPEPTEADKGERPEDEPPRVSVSERAKWREQKRRERAQLASEASRLASERAAIEKEREEARELLEAKRSGDPMRIMKANGYADPVAFEKAKLARLHDPSQKRIDELEQRMERERAEAAARESAAQERAAAAAREAEVLKVRSLLEKTHPGLHQSPAAVRCVYDILAATEVEDGESFDDVWAAATAAAEEKFFRREYEALSTYFQRKAGGKPAPAPADPDPPRPARRAITPGTARAASVEPARRAMTQAERDQAWEREWAKKLAQTMR